MTAFNTVVRIVAVGIFWNMVVAPPFIVERNNLLGSEPSR